MHAATSLSRLDTARPASDRSSDAAYWPRAPAGNGCEWKSHRRRGVHCAAATLRHRPCNLPITASRRVASPAHRTCLDLTRRYDTDNARSL